MWYVIYIGEFEQHQIFAPNEELAVYKWCAEQGYDSPGEAAAEYDLEDGDVRAIPLE